MSETKARVEEARPLRQQQASVTHPIRSRIDNSKCIFVPSSSFDNQTQLEIGPCDGSASEAFTRVNEQIRIGPNNSCLDVTGGQAQDGTPLQIYACVPGSANQRFARRSNGLIEWIGYNYCLSVSDPNVDNGAAIMLQQCDPNQPTQIWNFDVPAGEKTRSVLDPSKCLDVPSDSFSDNQKLQIYDCSNADGQNWIYDGDEITVGPQSICLDASSDVDQAGTLAQLYECGTHNPNQQFSTRSDGLIQWTGHDLCLNLSQGKTIDGTPIDFQVCDPNQASQQWHFGMYTPVAVSCKRGITYGAHAEAQLSSMSPSLGWWHRYLYQPELLPPDTYSALGLEVIPTAPGNDLDTSSFIRGEFLLTFNQLSFLGQDDLTPDEAAALWPQVQSIADQYNLKTIGPALNFATQNSGQPLEFEWYDKFFTSCTDCRVDYIAIHYKGCEATGLQSVLSAYTTRYGKPLWVTELSCHGSNIMKTSERLRYLKDTIAILEQDPNVFRYAWSAGHFTNETSSALFGADGTLTELGEAYRDAPGGCSVDP